MMERNLMHVCRSLLLLGAVACASAPPQQNAPMALDRPLPAPTADVLPDEPPPRPEIRVAWAQKPPAAPVIDGDLAEWGALPEAPSVTLSVTKDGAYLVANLAGAAKDGLWIELSAPAAKLHALGEWAPDGTFYEYTPETVPQDPSSTSRQVLEYHTPFVAEHMKRFQRLYRLDPKGILWDGGKGFAPVPDAVAVSRVTGDRLTAEVKLPLSALPRMSQAPANSFFLFAAAGPSTKVPEIEPAQRVQVVSQAGIHFEPLGALRAAAVAYVDRKDSLSYQPAQPNLVEIVAFRDRERGGTVMDATEQVLWEPVKKMGDLEVGYLHLLDTYLGLVKDSQLVEGELLQGQSMGFVERNKVLHFFSYAESWDARPARVVGWHVKTVDAAGKISQVLDTTSFWVSVEEFHTKSFDRFGLRGVPYSDAAAAEDGGPPPKRVEIAWRFDKKKGEYVDTERALPAKR